MTAEGRRGYRSFVVWLPFAVAAAIVVLDRITKVLIRDHFNSFESMTVISGWFRIIHTENPGAAFGMLADGNPMLRKVVLVGVSAAVLAFVIVALLKGSAHTGGGLSRIALGFILGGAVGNLYDRVALGTVTDFLEIYRGTWSFPAFNVADSAITVGAVLLFIDMLRPNRKQSAGDSAPRPTEY